jgi:hypothetical protein
MVVFSPLENGQVPNLDVFIVWVAYSDSDTRESLVRLANRRREGKEKVKYLSSSGFKN